MIRLFAALALPDPMAAALAGLEVGLPGARWVAPHNMHVTLRFVGDIEDGLAREVHDALAEVRAPPPQLEIDGFGVFGSRQPHALYAAVVKTPELARLQAKVEQAVNSVGLPPEPRKFTPHITLARLKGTPPGRLSDFMAGRSPFHLGPVPIGHMTLFRSHLGRAGAEYEPVAEYPLD